MSTVKAYASQSANSPLGAFEYQLAEIKNEEIEIKVEYCGLQQQAKNLSITC